MPARWGNPRLGRRPPQLVGSATGDVEIRVAVYELVHTFARARDRMRIDGHPIISREAKGHWHEASEVAYQNLTRLCHGIEGEDRPIGFAYWSEGTSLGGACATCWVAGSNPASPMVSPLSFPQ